jgi:hypothetical protein
VVWSRRALEQAGAAQLNIDWMSAKAQAPNSLLDISLSRRAECAREISSGGRPGRFFDSGKVRCVKAKEGGQRRATENGRVEGGAHGLPAGGLQLTAHGAGPGVGVGEQAEGLLHRARAIAALLGMSARTGRPCQYVAFLFAS